jgi:hypothetical protein
MSDGVYLCCFVHDGVTFSRKVVIKGDYYRFADEFGKPLPNSARLSVEVSVKAGTVFKPLPCKRGEEVVVWHRVEDTQPDDGITVMLFVPDNDSATTWPGWLEAEEWYWASGEKVREDVVAWCEMLDGLRDSVASR